MLPKCPSKFGDFLDFWGSATQKFSSSFHAKILMLTKKSHSIPTKIFHDQKINVPSKFYHNQQQQKILCPKSKKFPTCPCTTKKSQHVQNHNHKIFPWSNITYPTKFFPWPKFHAHKSIPYPQKFSRPTNLSILIPTKFCHVHEIKFTHSNKISHMHHEYIHTSLQHKFFTMSMPPKSKPKFIQQTSQITNIVKIP